MYSGMHLLYPTSISLGFRAKTMTKLGLRKRQFRSPYSEKLVQFCVIVVNPYCLALYNVLTRLLFASAAIELFLIRLNRAILPYVAGKDFYDSL